MSRKRIIPVASGKGGVGKTTFALHLALLLSRRGPTVLIDLDTGTSSVRTLVDTPVSRDLYHFFRRGDSLESCITTLPSSLDPRGAYSRFGFIAAPRHLIEDVTHFGPERRNQLIAAINDLEARFVILDLRAGFDKYVMDFLPYSNSGILVFTPRLLSATIAAADVVRGLLFRKMRIIFSPRSPFYQLLERGVVDARFVNELIDRVEDVYDDSLPNLESFVADLYGALGDHPVVRRVADILDYFRVTFVLNMFDGIQQSFDTAVKPFVENLSLHCSTGIEVVNLGWLSRDDEIHEGNCRGLPALLADELEKARPRKVRKKDAFERAMESLDQLRAGIREKPVPRRRRERPTNIEAVVSSELDEHLQAMKQMYAATTGADYRANLRYILSRIVYLMKTRRAFELGDEKLFTPETFLELIFTRHPPTS